MQHNHKIFYQLVDMEYQYFVGFHWSETIWWSLEAFLLFSNTGFCYPVITSTTSMLFSDMLLPMKKVYVLRYLLFEEFHQDQ